MKSITTKPDKFGWYYTFRKRNDGTIIIVQKNKKHEVWREVHVVGEDSLKALYEVLSS